jgi:hypothetical protein
LVEFALILPIFLLVLTGVIEFGYALYTWSAVSEVARIGIRYAVTGQYDRQYCARAAQVLGLGSDDLEDDPTPLDPTYDCVVPPTVGNVFGGTPITDFEEKTALLQDWARRPSSWDAAFNGGTVGMLFSRAVSGNYVDYLANPVPGSLATPSGTFSQNYRGDPTQNGYISISMCSNRSGVAIDSNNFYYYNGVADQDHRFLGICQAPDGYFTNDPDGTGPIYKKNTYYTDDAGGPGDRIRMTVTYNHPMIVPFFSAMWEHLKISVTQDAIVEKFRTSRLAGLSSGILIVNTFTPVPTITNTPEDTSTPTITDTPTNTNTPTITLTPTNTPQACNNGDGIGLLGQYYAYEGSNGRGIDWTNMLMSRIDPLAPNTYTPYPTMTARNTYTPYPSLTPLNTYTPYPTLTPLNTYTPYPNPIRSPTANGTLGSTNRNRTRTAIARTYAVRTSTALPTDTQAATVTLGNTQTQAATVTFANTYTQAATTTLKSTWTQAPFVGGPINFDWSASGPDTNPVPAIPADYFHARWTGFVYPPFPGEYTFVLRTDDGGKIFINGVEILTDWAFPGGQSATSETVRYTFPTCGAYTIQVDYYELTGSAFAKLGWRNDNLARVAPGDVSPNLSNNPVIAIPRKYFNPPEGTLVPTSTYRTPTRTNTAVPNTPTNTLPPTNTYTVTNTVPTPTSSNTPTVTNTVPTPTASNTPTRTHTSPVVNTPTITLCPGFDPDTGGCPKTATPTP